MDANPLDVCKTELGKPVLFSFFFLGSSNEVIQNEDMQVKEAGESESSAVMVEIQVEMPIRVS